jgi:RNA polymerase sigma-70 factor, ECF subfamily
LKEKGTYSHDELVVLIKNKDQQAFSYLYDNYYKALFVVINAIVDNVEESEDLLQNTFLKIWHAFDTYDTNKGRLYTWMINIARNVAVDFKRSKISKNQNQNVANYVDELKSNSVENESHNTIGLIDVVEKLSDDYVNLIKLIYYEGFTQQEISDQLKIPLGTVKTKLRKAMLILRDSLKEKNQAV